MQFLQRPFAGFTWDHPARAYWRRRLGIDPLYACVLRNVFIVSLFGLSCAVLVDWPAAPSWLVIVEILNLALVLGIMSLVLFGKDDRVDGSTFSESVRRLAGVLNLSRREIAELPWAEIDARIRFLIGRIFLRAEWERHFDLRDPFGARYAAARKELAQAWKAAAQLGLLPPMQSGNSELNAAWKEFYSE